MTLHSLYEIASRQLAGSKVKTFVGFVIGMYTVNLYDDFEKMGKKPPIQKPPQKKNLEVLLVAQTLIITTKTN